MREQKSYTLTSTAYKNLFDKLYAPLCVFANNYIDNIEICKDIVQEVFIKVWENKISFLHKNTVKSFLYTSVRNRSLDYLKSTKYKKTEALTLDKITNLENDTIFLREVVITETSIIIENAINTLPKKCAEIIRLSICENTNADIAKTLSISVNTVKTQKRIAYKKLRPLLKEHFFLILHIF